MTNPSETPTNTNAHRLIGIDPGTTIMGYAVIEIEKKDLRPLAIGVVHLHKLEDHQQKLKRIFLKVQGLINAYQPQEMAIEAPFYSKNVQSMLKLGRAQGVAMAAAILKGLPITEYSPRQIKQAVTGNGNASKEQVAAMLKTIIGHDFTVEYLDATDALATAVCHHFRAGKSLSSGKKYKDWSSFLTENPDRTK